MQVIVAPPVLHGPELALARSAEEFAGPTATRVARPAAPRATQDADLNGADASPEAAELALVPAPSGRRGGAARTFLAVVGVIVLGVATALAGFGAMGLGPAATLIAGRPSGAVAGVTSQPSASPSRAPSGTAAVLSTPLPSASGAGPVVVEAAFTRAWRIGPRTRGVVLTVLRNDSGQPLELDPAATSYRVARADGGGAAVQGSFSTIVPAQIPAGGRAYGVATLPAEAPHPRELGRVGVDPASDHATGTSTRLDVRDVVWSVDKNGQPRAAGLVTNTSSTSVDGATVAVVYLDRAARPVAVHRATTTARLDPGVSTPFESVTPPTAPVAPDAIVDVIAFAYEAAPD